MAKTRQKEATTGLLDEVRAQEPAGRVGLHCPRCGCARMKVVRTKHVEGGIDRQRECIDPHCGFKDTTQERW